MRNQDDKGSTHWVLHLQPWEVHLSSISPGFAAQVSSSAHRHPHASIFAAILLGAPSDCPMPMAFYWLSVSSFQVGPEAKINCLQQKSFTPRFYNIKNVQNEKKKKAPVLHRAKRTIAPSKSRAQVTGDPPCLDLPRLRRKALRPRRTSGPWPQGSPLGILMSAASFGGIF